jgi:serine/threonine protein kinase
MWQLKLAGLSLIDKLHSEGVYHRDIEPWNLFWCPSTSKLKIIDFEFAKFKENESEIRIYSWERQDRGEMEGILIECGVQDERYQP